MAFPGIGSWSSPGMVSTVLPYRKRTMLLAILGIHHDGVDGLTTPAMSSDASCSPPGIGRRDRCPPPPSVKVFGEEVRSSYRRGEEMGGLESEAKDSFSGVHSRIQGHFLS